LTIRPPAVSGTFYPSDPTILSLQLQRMYEEWEPPIIREEIIGMVVPHAGYAYSGFTAAACYAQLRSQTLGTIIIISPSHREYFNGISIYDGDAYRTPLGIVEIHKSLRDKFTEEKGIISKSKLGHRAEHSIEVQLPFLQYFSTDIRIVPIVIGDQRSEYCTHLGKLIAKHTANERCLLIASSDLSHMHNQETAQELDAKVCGAITNFSPMELLDLLTSGSAEACGGGPIVAVMTAALHLHATSAQVLHQCTSGTVTGDMSRVVGYLSAVFTKKSDSIRTQD